MVGEVVFDGWLRARVDDCGGPMVALACITVVWTQSRNGWWLQRRHRYNNYDDFGVIEQLIIIFVFLYPDIYLQHDHLKHVIYLLYVQTHTIY